MSAEDLPYRAEYAKSGRASCRGCKSGIEKETLRLAVMVQSPMFDGKVPHWYHMKCFFGKQRPKTAGDIQHFESLRYDDQQSIKEKIETLGSVVVPTKGGKGKKRQSSIGTPSSGLNDLTMEYAKSGRAMCRGCEQKILKGEIRISKKDYESDVGKRYGGQDMWHHLECFAKLRVELGYFETGAVLPGYHSLTLEDKEKVKEQLPAIKQEVKEEEAPVKKPKLEDEVDGKKSDDKIKKQTDLIFKYRDSLKNMSKKELTYLLEYNDQAIPVGESRILDRLCDVMAFGALEKCEKCKGQLVFNKDGYICTGDLTEWAKCQAKVQDPKRKPFKIPDDLKEDYAILRNYKYKPRTRIYNYIAPSTSVKKEDEVDSGPKVQRARPPLENMQFVITGIRHRSKLSKEIAQLGGKVIKDYQGGNDVMACISKKEVLNSSKGLPFDIEVAKSWEYHVVSEDFVHQAKDYAGKIPELIIKTSIADWGKDPNLRLPKIEPVVHKSKSKSHFTKSVPKSMKMKIKGGLAVDPDSGLEDKAHVYQKGDKKYTVVLGLTDIQSGRNSYYKLQLLVSDKKNRFWVFRSWGRISTTIGGNKLEECSNLHDAIKIFEEVYEDKTGNSFSNHDNFVKVPGKMYPIDVDYDQGDEDQLRITESDVPSKLKKPVQDLVRLVFDVDSMKKTMLEFELDMEKMPLGKLSKKQIGKAFQVLSELQTLINNNADEHSFIDASNRFYTYIPHSFGIDNPPLLNNAGIIKEKLDMLDSLMELEIAYNLMKGCKDDKSHNSLDNHYEQLKTDIDILERDSEEFKIIQEYVQNTHAATHSHYELEIDQVFTVKRQGEDKRFKPFKKLPNHKLLWHGSRTTNYAGILAQGLRIAPPEAPITGYMFGKGIYFADMVSKSANYCCTTPENNVGLMLLCDVALGNIYERTNADYIEKLPPGKHSVKGMGMTEPDSTASIVKDNIEIPLGKGQKVKGLKTTLLYNEYIVYDIAQVNVKYLLKLKFKYL